ncbi:MAG TPA: amidohydrolase family protein [Solirubrobacteraceae bacterium]|nr:amidohydrolase family protein [Solirubrobacteraceae bacterium]
MIVDAHHHLWDPARRDYPWMTGDAAALRRPIGLGDLRAAVEPLGVGATVAVQAASTEEETVELLALAAASGGLVAGVVGWIDLTAPDAGERLASLESAPGGERLVGIRHAVHDEPDPGWLDRDDVVRGLRAVARAGLPYDLLLFPEHIEAATRVAASAPELALVVDHGAKPRIAAGEREPWSSDLAALAAHEQVHCKLSGLVTEADRDGWREQDVAAYGERLLELFGPERLMFGSDWPVCTLAASYAEVLDLAHSVVAPLNAGEQEAVLAGTARRFYGLDGEDG